MKVVFWFARISFLEHLAHRSRSLTGIIAYLTYVAFYYYLWKATFDSRTELAGLSLREMVTYVAVGKRVGGGGVCNSGRR